MVMFGKYNLNQFNIFNNSIDIKKNIKYNLNNFNLNFDIKKKVMRSFLILFFIFYSSTPYNYFIFLGTITNKLIFKDNITLLSDNREFSHFYKKFN